MPNNPLNETYMEEHITAFLSGSPLYLEHKPSDFDIKNLVDWKMLTDFLKAQKESWRRAMRVYNNSEKDAVEAVVRELNRKIERGESYIKLLREGAKFNGITFKFVQFKPDMNLHDDNQALYEQNRFSVVRQMRYSLAPYDKDNEIDLCILINGLPIISIELKNTGTDQTVKDAMDQYKNDRDKNNAFLRRCLVHFAMDDNTVMMTTKLNGEDTVVLPFNKETHNPVDESDPDYATCYMWQDVLQADSLLNILQHFIKQYRTKPSAPLVTIFPRYHQRRVVNNIIRQIRTDGVGRNFLVQHSPGSGKTKSMAWLAHQLSNLMNADNTPVFDSIILVTDRIVLDRNLADDVKAFEDKAGTVNDIRRGSKKLAKALEEGSRIIVSTVQKFSFAIDHISSLAGVNYAVIIDEAHTAMGKEAQKDVNTALTENQHLQDMVDEYDPELETEVDEVMAKIQVARKQMKHISYFAFTATPKDRTFTLFGEPNKRAFDYYTMKQAIEEGFILDVLKNYTTFQTLFELQKDAHVSEEDMNKLYNKRKALALAIQYVNEHRYVINYKADLMINWFLEKTAKKLEGRAKAMVVTASRADAVRYKLAIDRLLHERYNDAFKTLVAFSGVVELNGEKYTEETMNGFGLRDNAIKIQFEEPEYKLLIVAEKFQTGFDQPLLHTMFVDKLMGGIQCVQTLSRLNRCYPGKEDTLVIDFVNKHEDVFEAFKPYYEETVLEGKMEPQRLYDYKADIEDYKIFSAEQVEEAAAIVAGKSSKNIESLSPLMTSLAENKVKALEKDEQDRYRKLVNRYVRQYGFLSQLMNFVDPELEKFYIFCKLLYKFLPYTQDTDPVDILSKIDLDKYRVQLREEGAIELPDEEGVVKAGMAGSVRNRKEDEEVTLNVFLQEINEPYTGFLTDNDKLIQSIVDELLHDPVVIQSFNAGNTVNMLINTLKERFEDIAYEKVDKYLNLMDVIQNNPTFSNDLFTKLVDFIFEFSHKCEQPDYSEELLKEAMIESMADDFDELCGHSYRDLEEVIDAVFAILKAHTIEKLDGQNRTTASILNNVFRAQNEPVFKQIYFGNLVNKFEAYLRKIYYLREGQEVPADEQGRQGLVNTVKKFPTLQRLHFSTTPEMQRFKAYYENLYAWRNEEAHSAPEVKDEEIDAALHIVVALYVFATMISITDLEMASFDMDTSYSPYSDRKRESQAMPHDEFPPKLDSVDDDREVRNLIYTRLQLAPDTSDEDLQVEVMKEFGERYPAMHILDWRNIILSYTPMVREAAKKPSGKIIEMQQRQYGMAAEPEDDYNSKK